MANNDMGGMDVANNGQAKRSAFFGNKGVMGKMPTIQSNARMAAWMRRGAAQQQMGAQVAPTQRQASAFMRAAAAPQAAQQQQAPPQQPQMGDADQPAPQAQPQQAPPPQMSAPALQPRPAPQQMGDVRQILEMSRQQRMAAAQPRMSAADAPLRMEAAAPLGAPEVETFHRISRDAVMGAVNVLRPWWRARRVVWTVPSAYAYAYPYYRGYPYQESQERCLREMEALIGPVEGVVYKLQAAIEDQAASDLTNSERMAIISLLKCLERATTGAY